MTIFVDKALKRGSWLNGSTQAGLNLMTGVLIRTERDTRDLLAQRKDHGRVGHPQAKERGIQKTQSCQKLDPELLTFPNCKKINLWCLNSPSVLFCYDSPTRLTQSSVTNV